MEIKNTNPDERYVVIMGPFDARKSAARSAAAGFVPYKALEEEFHDSKIIRDFYGNPATMDCCLYILVYVTAKGECRRKIGLAPVIPNSVEEMLSIVKPIGDMSGIKIAFDGEFNNIKTSFHSILRPVQEAAQTSVEQQSSCLKELLYAHNFEMDHPFENLAKIREIYLRQTTLRQDRALVSVGTFLQEYLENRDNYYRFVDKFTQNLQKCKTKLPTSFIPLSLSTVLFEFPISFKFKEFELKHAYVTVNKPTQEETILVVAGARYVGGRWDGSSFVSSAINIASSEDIETSLAQATMDVDEGERELFKEYVSLCLKGLIYISSAEPNLRPEKGAVTTKTNPAKLRKFFRYHDPFDSIAVGYGYHGINYAVDSTVVQGFFRWQRFGPGFSQVKLIWIDEFERHYKKD